MSAAFSLGEGVLDGKALDGFRGPGQHAPHSWSAALVSQTDHAGLYALVQLCPGSRQMVLRDLPRLGFVVNLGLDPAGRARERASTARLLKGRRPRPSGLHLIREGSYGLEAFSYDFDDTEPIACVVLRDSITSEDPAVLSVLRGLKDTHQVQLNSTLTERWCGLLRKVPHIRELRVKNIGIKSSKYRAYRRGCPWTTLHVAQDTCAQRLAWAPQPVEARLCVQLAETALLEFYVFPKGLAASVRERLAKCDITLGRGVRLRPYTALFRDDGDTYHNALAVALQQLTLLNLQGRKELQLSQFTMTPQTASLLQQEYSEWSLVLDRCRVVDITNMVGSGLLGSLTGLCDPGASLHTSLVVSIATGATKLREMVVRDLHLDKGSARWGVQALEKVVVLNPQVDTQQWACLPQALTHPYVVETHGQQSVQILVLPTIRSPQDAHTVPLRPVGRDMASAPAALRFTAGPKLKSKHHAAALHTLLTRIRYHEWDYTTLVLFGWRVKPAVLNVLRAAAAKRPGLRVYMYHATLHVSSCVATDGPLTFLKGVEIVGKRERGSGTATVETAADTAPGRSGGAVSAHEPAAAAETAADTATHGGYTTSVPPNSISWWLRASELNGLFARLSKDASVGVWDCGLVFDLRHATESWPMTLLDVYDSQDILTGAVVPHKLEFYFTRPALTTYIVQPPALALPLDEQAACMRLNTLQLQYYRTPDILVIDGFAVSSEVAAALRGVRVGHAMHLGPNLVYSTGTDETATQQCQEFGAALPDPRRSEWVVNGAHTKPRQLADLLLGRDALMGSKVHVVTHEDGYVTAVRQALGARPVNIQACAAAPSFLSKGPGVLWLTLLQYKDGYTQAMRAAGTIAGALRRAAERRGIPMDLDTTTMYQDARSADALHNQARDLGLSYVVFRMVGKDTSEQRLSWVRKRPTPEELFNAAAALWRKWRYACVQA